MIIGTVIVLLMLCLPVLVVRRSNIKTAQLRAYGHELWLDRYNELVAWAESVVYPDRLELVAAALPDDVRARLFPQPEPVVEVASVIRTADRDATAGRCINDREHDWITEKVHHSGGFVRAMHYCGDCKASVTEMIVGELERAEVRPQTQVEQLRALLAEKAQMLRALSEGWEHRSDATGNHFRLTQEDHRLYLDVVRSAQEVKHALEEAKRVEHLQLQQRQIAAATSVPADAFEGLPTSTSWA